MRRENAGRSWFSVCQIAVCQIAVCQIEPLKARNRVAMRLSVKSAIESLPSIPCHRFVDQSGGIHWASAQRVMFAGSAFADRTVAAEVVC